MGSIILKPPACTDPQGNPSPLFEVRAGNGCGGDPILSLLKSELESGRQPFLVHCLPRIKPLQPLQLPSLPLRASPGRTLLRQHWFWVCWLHQRPARKCVPCDQPGRPPSPPQAPILTPEMLLSLLYHLQRASIKTPCACRDLITDYLCCLPFPSAPPRQSQPPAGEKESIHHTAALPPRRGQPALLLIKPTGHSHGALTDSLTVAVTD